MQSFSFKSDYDENQNIERIIHERNRKLVKQQVAFALLLFVLVGLLVWYIARKVIYAEFDGYIQTEYMDYRAVDDIYLFRQFREVGDIVVPGDTLYSFIFLSNLLGMSDLNSEPSVIVNDRNLRLQRGIAYSDANVLRVRISELEKQIAREDNNIRFGLTDNSHKMDLERELAEAREQLRAVLNKAGIYANIQRESSSAVQRFGLYNSDILDEQLDGALLRRIYEQNPAAIRYAIASDTAVVTKLWSPPFSRVFKKEHIIQLEELSLEKSNMQVVAYIPTGDMGKINNHTKAEVIVNDDVSFTASVQLLGARTEDLPDELRNSLSHTYTTVMVVFAPDPDQVLPLWAVVDRVPVKVRIRNYDNGRRNDGSDYWYIDRNGLTRETRRHLGLLRNDSAPSEYRYARERLALEVEQSDGVSLRAGQAEELLQSETGTDRPAAAEPEVSENRPEQEPSSYIYHKVKSGEGLYRIARRYGTTMPRILECNPEITDPELIVQGAVLRIPKEATAGPR